MMCVIVNKQKALALIFDLEPAPRVLELTKRSCDLFKRNSKLDSERDHAQGIVDIVRARHVQHRFAEFLFAKINTKIRAKCAQLRIRASVIGFIRETERNCV